MSPDDRELAWHAREGGREAFDLLVERHGPAILAFLRRAAGRAGDAEDLFQETFLRAFRHIRTLREPERVGGWLARIAGNAVRRHFERSRARIDAGPLDEEPADGAEPPPDEPLDASARAEDVRSAIDRLPDRQRAVLSMRVDLGLGFAAIGEALGIREDNARAHHYQALKRLREQLAPPADPVSSRRGLQ